MDCVNVLNSFEVLSLSLPEEEKDALKWKISFENLFPIPDFVAKAGDTEITSKDVIEKLLEIYQTNREEYDQLRVLCSMSSNCIGGLTEALKEGRIIENVENYDRCKVFANRKKSFLASICKRYIKPDVDCKCNILGFEIVPLDNQHSWIFEKDGSEAKVMYGKTKASFESDFRARYITVKPVK